ncbi:putative serpin-Z5 [Miscanthus floridulus]|uniref:putative serpin-Z5 n=1 Tax=Miscanthus floridulus TaxID=154761 RepID=UPI00345882A1
MAAAATDAAIATRDGQTALALRLAKHLAPPAPGAEDSAAAAIATNKNVAFSPVSVDASRGRLTDAFRDVAAEAYKSEARTVSFTEEPEAAVKMINSWVKKATDNLIESIISTGDINADSDLVLANAVYFKGDWMEPFQPCGTSTFHLLDGRHTKAEFMSMSYYTLRQVACMDGFKVLKIPYKEAKPDGGSTKPEDEPSVWPHASKASRYSMFVFLPDTHDGMATMVDVVTASPAFMYSILAQMKLRWVNLKLPKFKITFNWGNLKETLCQLGLTLPFSPEAADLRGMCDGDGKTRQQALFLSKVAHMAVVNVNEKGTEAGAVALKLRGGGGPPDIVEFTADHPFTFFIMEERSGVIVFVGHVLDPTK